MPKGGCRGCRERDPINDLIQTRSLVCCQGWPVNLFLGVFTGAYRGAQPSWRVLGSI